MVVGVRPQVAMAVPLTNIPRVRSLVSLEVSLNLNFNVGLQSD